MADLKYLIEACKEAVPAIEAARDMGITVGRDGRSKCPFCNITSRESVKFYGSGYHCFTCTAGGDVIDLAQRFLGVDAWGAVRWLNEEFGLKLPVDGKTDRRAEREARRRREEIRRKIERLRKQRLQAFLRVLNLGVWLSQIEDWKLFYSPLKPEDEYDRRFLNAIRWELWFREELERMQVYNSDDYWNEREKKIREGGALRGAS